VARAEASFMIGLESGVCVPTERRYLDDDCHSIFAGARFTPIDLQVSISNLGTFKHETFPSTKIDAAAASLLAVPHIRLGRHAAIDLFGGAAAWRAKAEFAGFDVGTDEGYTWTAGAGVAWRITRFFEMRLRWQYYDDVSGTRINASTVGANFTLGSKSR
jgi:OOP family OmpA-OmpF porin